MAKKTKPGTIAVNKRARYDYEIKETIEAGIILLGTEVKSLRLGQANIADAHATEQDGDIVLLNLHIPEYKQANRFNHEPYRVRKLLLHKREIAKLIGAVKKKGATLIPMSLYFNERGVIKVQLGLGTGKKKIDKRATEKDRDWSRQKSKIMKDQG